MSINTVTFKGATVPLAGSMLQEGTHAPEFTYVTADLKEQSSYDLNHNVLVILAVPSLDTGICAKETRQFNEKLAHKEGVQTIVISKDLPFAMKRFCELEGIKNVTPASDYRYNEFADAYQLTLEGSPLKGLLARAVFVVDKHNIIQYAELVPEITEEPLYDKVMDAVDELLAKL